MDIDIDVQSQVNPAKIFNNITYASINEAGKLKKHNVGVYFQNIPKDPETGLSAITYKKGLDLNFFKVDIIHLKLLDKFESKDHLRKLMYEEPDWSLLLDEDVVTQLFHLSKSFELLKKVKPKSIMELSDCLALIRPNKVILVDKYIKEKDKTAIRKLLYQKEDSSDLRKSHAIPYAYLIVAQLNLIKREYDETTNLIRKNNP